MEQGDADQRRRKEEEVHRDAEQSGRGSCAISRLRYGRRKQQTGQRQHTARQRQGIVPAMRSFHLPLPLFLFADCSSLPALDTRAKAAL